MALDITRMTTSTAVSPDYWNDIAFAEIEVWADATDAAIAAFTNWADAEALLTAIKTVDGATSGLDAQYLAGESLAEVIAAAGGGEDRSFPGRSWGRNAGDVASVATHTKAQGITIDVKGTVWVGLQGATNVGMREIPGRDIDGSGVGTVEIAPGGTPITSATYKIVDLLAVDRSLFALLAGPTVDGWAAVAVAPGTTQGKLAKFDLDTGALDATFGTAGVLDLADGGTTLYDPWRMCCDGTNLYIAFLTGRRVASVAIADGSTASVQTGANYVNPCAINLIPTLGGSLVVVGFHAVVTGQAYGALCTMTTALGSLTYYAIDDNTGDMHQVTNILTGHGVVLVALAQGSDKMLIGADVFDFGAGGVLTYYEIGLKSDDSLTPAATLATAGAMAMSPEGTGYVAAGTANGHLMKFSGAPDGPRALSETQHVAAGASVTITGLLHDGRSLWYIGVDASSKAMIGKVAI